MTTAPAPLPPCTLRRDRGRAGFLALVVAGLASLSPGCAVRPAADAPRAALAISPAIEARYASPGPTAAPTVRVVAHTRAFTRAEIELAPRLGPDPKPWELPPIRCVWVRPHAAGAHRCPAVVISPILGDDTLFVAGIADRCGREGWHAVIVRRGEVDYDPRFGLEQVEDRLRSAVARQREVVDWLVARADVDAGRVAAFGISAGGIQAAMSLGSDPRYAAGVIALAGGPLADVFVDTEEGDIRRPLEAAMRATGLSRDAMRARMHGVIRTDPVLLAPHVAADRVLLVIATKDRSVPTVTGERLHGALGRPAVIRVPLGHYGTILALPFLTSRAFEFLRDRLRT